MSVVCPLLLTAISQIFGGRRKKRDPVIAMPPPKQVPSLKKVAVTFLAHFYHESCKVRLTHCCPFDMKYFVVFICKSFKSSVFHCLLACCTFQAIESGILQSVKMCCIPGRNSHMRASLYDGQLYGKVMVPHRFRKGTSWLQILPKHRLPPKPIAIVSINFLFLKITSKRYIK